MVRTLEEYFYPDAARVQRGIARTSGIKTVRYEGLMSDQIESLSLDELKMRLEYWRRAELHEKCVTDGISHDLRRIWRELEKLRTAIRDKKEPS